MTSLSFKNLVSANQIKTSDIEKLVSVAEKYQSRFEKRKRGFKSCSGKILASLFFEPSTRTRFSFESAILRLGGQIITLEQGQSSSVNKGESLEDMGKILNSYADIAVVRHPEINSVKRFSKYSNIPVINAGDGSNEHPTQSLVDIYTILKEKKRLDNLNIGILGDIKYGRTAYSLINLLAKYPNNNFTLISHPSLRLEENKKKKLLEKNIQITETKNLQKHLPNLDVLYVTRVQKERFSNEQEYEKVKNEYRITKNSLKNIKKDMIIMHPLPRVDEISTEVDQLSNAKHFQQAHNGVFIRMALLSLI